MTSGDCLESPVPSLSSFTHPFVTLTIHVGGKTLNASTGDSPYTIPKCFLTGIPMPPMSDAFMAKALAAAARCGVTYLPLA